MKLIILLLLTASTVYSAQKAKILFVRGDVTALKPGAMEAVKVKRGETYPEQTSILTKGRSVVKIRFSDASTINLGPNSKVVVTKMPKKEANIVNVLTGVIKSSVNKNSNKTTKTKLLVKTQSAVMGVRGTKFQTSYSPKTNKTSLVTVEGEVKMAKVEKFNPKPVTVEEVDEVLETPQKTVTVTPGKFAVIEEEIAKPTEPTNIAPQQFDIIAKELNSKATAKVVMNDSRDDKEADGKQDIRNDLIKYKAGGYVDFATGEYIEPTKTAQLDKKTNTYTAPKEVKVKKDGSVIVPEELKKKKAKKRKAKNEPSFWSKYLPETYRVGVFFMPFSEKQTIDNKERNEESTFFSKSAHFGGINIDLKWNETIRTILNLGGGKYKLNSEDLPLEEYGDGNFIMDLRLEYKLSELWTGIGALSSRSYRFAFEDFDPSNPRIRTEDRDLLFLSLGASRKIQYLESHNLVWSGLINLFEKKSMWLGASNGGGDEEVSTIGLFTDIEASYTVFDSYFIRPSLWFEYANHSADTKDYSRSRIGAKVLVQKEF